MKKILIVDDQKLNRTLLQRKLSRQGFEISEADSGQAALDHIRQEKPDLILLDVLMPEMSGLEVLKTIRAKFHLAELPIIMVTAKDGADDIADAFKLGANDYITKPVKMTVAGARINSTLNLVDAQNEYQKYLLNKNLAETTERLSLMLGQVAHEINNPLTIIKGNLQLLKINTSLIQKVLPSTQKANTRVQRIFRGLKASLHGKPLDQKTPQTLIKIDDIIQSPRILMLVNESRHIDFSYPKNITFQACATKETVAEIFYHLISNAFDAIKKTPEKKKMTIAALKKEHSTEIYFKNEATPIPLLLQRQIFDPFFTTKDVGKGLGLGLTESYFLAKSFGGELTLEKSNKEETTFLLTIPEENKP